MTSLRCHYRCIARGFGFIRHPNPYTDIKDEAMEIRKTQNQ